MFSNPPCGFWRERFSEIKNVEIFHMHLSSRATAIVASYWLLIEQQQPMPWGEWWFVPPKLPPHCTLKCQDLSEQVGARDLKCSFYRDEEMSWAEVDGVLLWYHMHLRLLLWEELVKAQGLSDPADEISRLLYLSYEEKHYTILCFKILPCNY